MDGEKGGVGVGQSANDLWVLRDRAGEPPNPADAIKHANLGARFLERVNQGTGNMGWQHITAGFCMKPMDTSDPDRAIKRMQADMRTGHSVAIVGVMTLIGQIFLQECGREDEATEWDLWVLKEEWMRVTLTQGKNVDRVLPMYARRVGLAEGDLPGDTPCVFIDCSFCFKKREPT